MHRSSLLTLATLLLASPSLTDDLKPIADEAPALGRPVEFDADIRPILERNCLACHNSTTAESDLNLESVDAMLKGGINGAAIVATKPEESLLWKLARRGEEPVMPPMPNDRQAKELTPAELGLVKLWIMEGAAKGTGAAKKSMNWQPISPELRGVYSLDLDPTGRFIAAGRANRVTIYDMVNREVPVRLVDPAIVSGAGTSGSAVPARREPSRDAPSREANEHATHRDFVHAVAFHPTEPIVATSGYRNVKLWRRDVDRTTVVGTSPADTTLIATGNDSLVAASATQGLVVINSADGSTLATIPLDGQTVTAVTAFRSEPRWIVAATSDQRIVVVRSAGSQIAHRSEPLPTAVSSLSHELDGSRIAAVLADGSVRVLSVAADTGIVAMGPEVKSDAGAISRIVGIGPMLVTIAGTRTVQTWNPADGAQIGRFEAPGDVAAVTINPVADRAVFVLSDGRAVLWSLKESREIAALTSDLTATRSLKRAEANKAMNDLRVNVAKTRTDEAEKDVVAQKDAETKAKAEVDKQVPLQAEAQKKFDEAAAKTAEARKALEAKADDDALKNAVTEAEKAETAAKDALMKADTNLASAKKSVEFATQAIARAEQRVVERKQQHDTATAESTAAAAIVEQQRGPAAIAVTTTFAGLTSDGRTAWTFDAANSIRLWNAADGLPLDVLPAVELGSPVITADTRETSVLLRLADHRIIERPLFPGWSLLRSIGSEDDPSSPFVDRVLALAFSPDGGLLATGGGEPSRSGELMLWNTSDGSLVRQISDAHSDTVFGIEFSPDGQLLASAAADKFARVFDVTTGAPVRAFEGHTHHVMDVSWKADRTTLVSAGADNVIKVWNAETGEQSRTINTYSRQVTSLQFVGQQDLILSGSGDKRVFLHNPGNGQPTREFPGNSDYVYRVATNPDGTLIVSGGEDGSVRVWNAADAAVVEVFEP